MQTVSQVPVAVLGASGYAGGELVRLLLGHPGVYVGYLGGKDSSGWPLAEIHPHLSSVPGAETLRVGALDPDQVAGRARFALLSLPHGASSELAPALLDAGMHVIDLGGDFRLRAPDYPEWYGFDHPAPAWLDKAVYGLPELFAEQIMGASLVANPGCFPTPVVLGLSPLVAAGLIDRANVHIDGKTGLSGAGKSPSEGTGYSATQESVRPYRFPRHQHTPEMERGLELATGTAPTISFVPHLVPAVRGVLVTCYARLTREVTTEDLTELLASAYADAPFVRVLPAGRMVDTKRTRASNVVELQAVADLRTGTAIVEGALDNLVKGAAGQAIQNMNLMAGYEESLGLPMAGAYP